MHGRKPKPFNARWSAELAYVVGLIATDGCLYRDGRHVDITSKDIQLLETVKRCLNIEDKISKKTGSEGRSAYHLQLTWTRFHQWLMTIGLTPAKSKTIGPLKIPDEFFVDFFRGVFDGDGSFYRYWDPRWRSSLMYYLCICSASKKFLYFLRVRLRNLVGVQGALPKSKTSAYQLRYAKRETEALISWMYYDINVPCLHRKREKIVNTICGRGAIGTRVCLRCICP